MWRDIVRRIQALAVVAIGEHGDRSVELVAHHAPHAVFARNLPALVIECVAVAVVRRHPEHRHPPVILEPAHLAVVRDVAPHQVPSLAGPRRSFAPHPAAPEPLNRSVVHTQAVEARIERDDIWIRITDWWRARCVIAWRERR